MERIGLCRSATRAFRKRNKDPHGRDPHRGITNLYRYEDLFTDPNEFLKLVDCIPFLNGGLFECLDQVYRAEENRPDIRIDGFSDHPKNPLCVPDFLFFGDERAVDLSKAYGEAKYKRATVRGLIHIFNSYNFTVTEATPLDQDVALDPACGSGAFPMGLLHKLVFILGKLDPHNERWKQKQIAKASEIPDATVREKALADIEQAFAAGELDYGRKLFLIENCIYGVDIQPIAVQIAKMRFFISLTIDQKIDPSAPNLGIRPLPNLETKFVAANTLIGIERPAQQMLRNPQIDAKEAELRQVRERHFTARTPATKAKCRELDAKLRAEISELLRADGFPRETTEKLTNWNPYDQNASADFFDPEWMFGIRDGFDIVLGNPPYVRQEDIKELKSVLRAQGYDCYTGTADLFVYFFERGLQMLRTGGVLSYITSNKYLRAAYGERLRAYLAHATHPRVILDFGDAPVFTSIAYPCIFIAEKTRHVERGQLPDPASFAQPGRLEQLVPDRTLRVHTWNPDAPLDQFVEIFERQAQPLVQRDLKPDGWRLAVPAALRLLEKLRRAGTPLGDYVQGRFYYGIKTGLNEAFVVDRATRDRLISEHPSSAEVLKPFLRGRDIKRWRCEFADQYLIRIESSENVRHPWSGKSAKEAEHIFAKTYPAIHAWFDTLREPLIKRYDQGQYFWELRSCDYWREFEQPKIIVPAISETVNAAVDDEGFLANNKTTIFVSERARYLAAVVNSPVAFWFATQVFASKQGGFWDFEPRYSGQWPIPPAPPAEQQMIERLVDKILSAKRADAAADTSAWEREIDQHVYRLYGLTPEEIKIVEEGMK